MFIVYNFLQVILITAGLPLLVLLVLIKKKYRGRIAGRLGFGLHKRLSKQEVSTKKTIWIHSLSVGEVTSSLPLVRGIREEMDNVFIVYSVTTQSGMKVAEANIRSFVDTIIPAPLDFYCTIRVFLKQIQPDLFILVETDFWPNWLWLIQKANIPAMLVNGRISESSFNRYQRFSLFFKSLFQSFSLLSMQTKQDSRQMQKLGISESGVVTLGNLKYDTAIPGKNMAAKTVEKSDLNINEDNRVWICGSTHRGEEEILLTVYAQLKPHFDNLIIIIAPRDPERAREIIKIAQEKSIPATCRTTPGDQVESLLILDTIGELTQCYRLADVAFIGGSMVSCGGHNPLEAASCNVPVLYGHHMEDFLEIARDLEDTGGGRVVHTPEELADSIHLLLSDPDLQNTMGQAAGRLVSNKSGVVQRHLEAIRTIL